MAPSSLSWICTAPGLATELAVLLLLGCGGGSGDPGTADPGRTDFAGCHETLPAYASVVEPDSAAFAVVGTQAFMYGTIDGQAPARVEKLIANNPAATEAVLQNCHGSADDGSSIVASRMVRTAGLNTRTEAATVLASGAVDFFLAGAMRSADPASEVHVHSWVDGNGTLGRDLPRDSCDHAPFVAYYRDMGLADPSGFVPSRSSPACPPST